ncbi:MAG: hypothetical protein OSJ72_10000 [Lachnospiraceae bacterium]|nr:hypothetical protein [Lachnospiraceae bacterium]
MTPAQQFINNRGIMFKVERNGCIVSELKGLPNHERSTSRKYIGFMPDSDVQSNDWLINPANERFYVADTVTDFFHQQKSQLKAYYQTVTEHNANPEKATAIFNIENATNSVIGTQSTVTMNINNSIQDAKDQISSSGSSDKEELQQIISLLEMVVNNQVPAQKGLLSKFASVIQRNSWIASPISSILLNWLLTQAPSVLP